MPNNTDLSDALAMAEPGLEDAKRPAAGAGGRPRARAAGTSPHRGGRINVTGYFDPIVERSLRRIQAKYPDRTVQGLLAEALDDLFDKYGVLQPY
jgi:hypothetical protein